MTRLADFAYRRKWLVLAAAVAFTGVAGAFGGPVATLLTSGGSPIEDPDSESIVAREELEIASGVGAEVAVIALVRADQPVRSAAVRSRVGEIAAKLELDPAVASVLTFYDADDAAFVSRDGDATYVAAFIKRLSSSQEEEAATRLKDEFAGETDVLLGGPVITSAQLNKQVEKDLARAELIAFPLLFVLSLFVFRGVVAAFLPLIVGAVAILGTFLGLRVVNEFTPLSIFALNLVTAVGLGLAIDYSLFVVSRYREELARGGSGGDALRRTLSTAGRTVMFSALTVAAALASLLVFPQPFLYSMAVGGILIALISGAAALIVLPAILVALGPRVNALAPARWQRAAERSTSAEQAGFWYRLSRTVMRRPGLVAAVTAAALVALGIPFLGIEFNGVDARVLPTSASAYQVQRALDEDFPANRANPIFVAAEAPRSAAAEVEAYAASLGDLEGAAAVREPRLVGDALWRIDVIPRENALADSTQQLVGDVRAAAATFPLGVGGQAANFVDEKASIADHLPYGIGILVLTTLVLLFAMTGSVVLPVKGLLMNALTLSATFGVLVLVFQDGRFEGLLDYESPGAIDLTQPLLIGATAFALSTDYSVFLLTRIKEALDSGASNSEAVAFGLERTGRIVTAAALLLSVAIGAFSTSEVVFIKEIGVGILVAVLLDATLVRALLVPSLMELLGHRNWWAPASLKRLHARLGLTESA